MRGVPDEARQPATRAAPPEESVDARVRRRLREFRVQRGLTLQQVADQLSIDISTLSRIEAGKRRLALDHIPGLAAALGVSADELLGSPSAEDPRVRNRPRRHDGMRVCPLTRLGSAGGLRAFRITIDRERQPPHVLPVHEGLDWVYVLEGSLRLRLGDQRFTIEQGEVAEFWGWMPHWLGAIGGPVEVIMVLGPHGERLHLHR
jgi:transcriptional regulator with XRE-family HTH domain